MSEQLLVLGRHSMLARAVAERAARRGWSCTLAGRPEVDLARPESLAALPWDRVGTVINCVAWTDVDGAETQEAEATAINGHGVAALWQHCRAHGRRLVHLSTDYVFDGRGTAPMPVDAPRAPISAYGRSKALGEAAIEAAPGPALVVRTSWLYAPWGKNFVRTIAAAARTRPSLRVVDDQRGRPTSAEHLAETTLDLLQSGAEGTWHATDGGQCSWFELACRIAAQVAPSCRVEPCTTAEFPRPAPRPAYSVLDISRTEAQLGRPLVPWTEAVDDVLARLE
jgi:dTDP-4-dehydrorhamnose reductase